MPLDVPVALLIFNRPETTARVFEAIASARPRRLLIVADGPRADRPGEVARCEAARQVINRVDWPCDVQTDFSPVNLGCGKRVASGLDWVFGQCEQAIILEDDCLPCADFFRYCESLLDRYRDDSRIMHIGGNNFHGSAITYPGSYYFTRFPHIWGWASWRRAWQHYDFEMKSWPKMRDCGGLSELFSSPIEEAHFRKIFENVYTAKVDTWDVQWPYALLTRGALAINPAKNLVSNLGFGADATHTGGSSWMGNLPTEPIGELHHPQNVIEHRSADERTFNVVFGGAVRPPKFRQRIYRAALRRLKRASAGGVSE